MKKQGHLLAPPPPKEVIEHEKTIARKVDEIEVVDEEREERLERMRRKMLEWKAKQTCKNIVMELIGEAVQESALKLCRELVEDVLVGGSWEDLEVNRLMKEVEGGGVRRRKLVEIQLRNLREEDEAVEALLAEE